jgi:hypothetical protein
MNLTPLCLCVIENASIYGAGEYISKLVLNLVNGRMLKWGVTRETLKKMNLDKIIQVQAR